MSPSGALSRLELGDFLLPARDFAPSVVALQPLVPPAHRDTRSRAPAMKASWPQDLSVGHPVVVGHRVRRSPRSPSSNASTRSSSSHSVADP
jgi:hypothetical protein